MATISPNDHAPDTEVQYNLPTATFDLAPGGSYETDDRRVLTDAEAHPWLQVEYPEAAEVGYTVVSGSVPYEDDVLAAVNSQAFDPELIAKTEADKAAAKSAPTAIDAGLDQGDDGTSGTVEGHEVSTTIASAEVAQEAAQDEEVEAPVPTAEVTPEPEAPADTTTPRWSADQEG